MPVITLTVPDKIYAALEEEGRELEQAPGEVLKSGLHMAYRLEQGWTLKLKPSGPQKPDAGQQELPFGSPSAAAATT